MLGFLARRLLAVGVLVMPGETLGVAGGFRLSFARKPDALAEGLRRIDAVLRPHAAGERLRGRTPEVAR